MAALQHFASSLLSRRRDKSVPPKLGQHDTVPPPVAGVPSFMMTSNPNINSEINYTPMDFSDDDSYSSHLRSPSLPVVKLSPPPSSFFKGKRNSLKQTKEQQPHSSNKKSSAAPVIFSKNSFGSVQEAARQFGGKAKATVPPMITTSPPPYYPLSLRKVDEGEEET